MVIGPVYSSKYGAVITQHVCGCYDPNDPLNPQVDRWTDGTPLCDVVSAWDDNTNALLGMGCAGYCPFDAPTCGAEYILYPDYTCECSTL